MDFNREWTSITKSPLLNGSNYAYCKVRMIVFVGAIDDHVWDIVQDVYTDPIIVVDWQTKLKPKAQWTNVEKTRSNYNNKAINTIIQWI